MKTFSMTDIGKLRQVNQDYMFASDEVIGTLPNLFIVADGMGGHNAGDYASRFTVERVTELIRESEETEPEKLLEQAIVQTNQELMIKASSQESLKGMGTTFVAATLIGRHLHVANVGDSRLYVINKEVIQITKDHSYVQEMVNKGELKEEDARCHPQKNIITRAVGAMPELKVDFFDVVLDEEDQILLCSDGLTNMLEDAQIGTIVHTQRDIVEKVERLVEAANENGGNDNITVVMIEPF